MEQPQSQPDVRFADWVDGRLDPDQLIKFEAELRDDPALRRQADEYLATVQSVRGALRGGPPELSAPEVGTPETVSGGFADRVMASVDQDVGVVPRSESGSVVRRWPWVATGLSAVAAATFAVLALQGVFTADRQSSPEVHDALAGAAPRESAPSVAKDGFAVRSDSAVQDRDVGLSEDEVGRQVKPRQMDVGEIARAESAADSSKPGAQAPDAAARELQMESVGSDGSKGAGNSRGARTRGRLTAKSLADAARGSDEPAQPARDKGESPVAEKLADDPSTANDSVKLERLVANDPAAAAALAESAALANSLAIVAEPDQSKLDATSADVEIADGSWLVLDVPGFVPLSPSALPVDARSGWITGDVRPRLDTFALHPQYSLFAGPLLAEPADRDLADVSLGNFSCSLELPTRRDQLFFLAGRVQSVSPESQGPSTPGPTGPGRDVRGPVTGAVGPAGLPNPAGGGQNRGYAFANRAANWFQVQGPRAQVGAYLDQISAQNSAAGGAVQTLAPGQIVQLMAQVKSLASAAGATAGEPDSASAEELSTSPLQDTEAGEEPRDEELKVNVLLRSMLGRDPRRNRR